MKTLRLGYLRISKDDFSEEELKKYDSLDKYLRVKWKQQEDAIKEKFNITEFNFVYRESGSAYDLNNMKNRSELKKCFLRVFGNFTMEDVFFNRKKAERPIFELFVWDYNRISRIFEINLLFQLICDLFEVHIFSYNQGYIKKKDDETPVEKLSRFMLCSISAFSSEEYSYNISQNTRKAFNRTTEGISYSYYGNKSGRKFKNLEGNKIEIEIAVLRKLYQDIEKKIKFYEKNKYSQYYDYIMNFIKDKYGISISRSFLTKIKKKVLEGDSI